MISKRRLQATTIVLVLGAYCLAVPDRTFAQDPGRGVTVERDLRLGDAPIEGAVVSNNVGSALGGFTYDGDPNGNPNGIPLAGNIDPLVAGGGTAAPVYATGVGGSGIAAQFDGTDDFLRGETVNGIGGLGFPGNNPPANNPVNNYAGIVIRGLQFWANPDNPNSGARQDLVNDTYQFGVHISAGGNWGMTWGAANAAATVGNDFVSNVPVTQGVWSHVQQHSLRGSAVLYVDGVATMIAGFAPGQIYRNHAALANLDFTVGSNLTADGNFFDGKIDDIEVYVAGDNRFGPPTLVDPNTTLPNVAPENQAAVLAAAEGHFYGSFNLGLDNHFIAIQLAGKSNADVNANGLVNQQDINIFVANYSTTPTVFQNSLGNDVIVPDLNSRKAGDLNFDGYVDFADASLLVASLSSLSGPLIDGLNLAPLSRLGQAVPEPVSGALLAFGLMTLSCRRTRAAKDMYLSATTERRFELLKQTFPGSGAC